MIFGNLKMEGFKSFIDEAEINLDLISGLYFVTGNNLEDKKLGANGTGKSSIWDAVCWVLYGKTLRNLKAGNVKSWNYTGRCKVSLEINDSLIERTWSPITLKKDGKDITQEELEDYLGIGFEGLYHAIIMGQFSPMFFDLSPTEKSVLFSSVFDLEIWDSYSAHCKDKVNILVEDLMNVAAGLSNKEGKLNILNEYSYKDQLEDFKLSQEKKLDAISHRMDCIDNVVGGIDDKQVRLIREGNSISEDIIIAENKIIYRSELISNLKQDLSEIEVNKIKLETKISIAQKHLDGYQILGDVCSTCGQDINDELTHVLMFDIEFELESDWKVHKEMALDLTKLEERLERKKDKRSLLEKELSDYRTNIAVIDTKKHALEIQRRELDNIDDLRVELVAVENEVNPYIEKQEKLQLDIITVTHELEKLADRKKVLNSKLESYKYWVTGFKNIRLTVISENLERLQLEVNSSLEYLGLSDWNIYLDIDKENKTGGIKKGFNVMVQSPYNDEQVPWEVWSGGESQRLRLAGAMGMSNMILDGLGIESNIEVWDEPSNWLSEEGITDLLEILHTRARDLNKVIFIVDHRSLEFGGFESIVNVVKDKNGSFINGNK